jgi:hypothetical protein
MLIVPVSGDICWNWQDDTLRGRLSGMWRKFVWGRLLKRFYGKAMGVL